INPGGTARMEVFRWQEGTLKSDKVTVGPGDAIGKVINGVDFNTGYTLVDVRMDNNDPSVLLLDPDGMIVRRSFRADQANPDLQKLHQQVAQAAAANGTPGAPGGPGAAGAVAGSRGPGG